MANQSEFEMDRPVYSHREWNGPSDLMPRTKRFPTGLILASLAVGALVAAAGYYSYPDFVRYMKMRDM